ncbi:MAG: CapA family protein [Bacillota bacterium]|jgi:poly-gamma-glutamate capsule biosynthesis protein CapA/YwtB (metallophosphatase superfamily)
MKKNHTLCKKISAAAALLTVCLALFAFSAGIFGSTLFQDVKYSSWYYFYVKYDYDHGIMKGTSATSFLPGESMSRAMTVQTVYNLAGRPPVAECDDPAYPEWRRFSDVADSAWYAEAVRWAWQTGVTTGVTETLFRPDQPVTREEFAAFLYRYEKYLYEQTFAENGETEEAAAEDPAEGTEVPAEAETPGFDETYAPGDLTRFKDGASVSEYARTPLSWAVSAGLFLGTNQGNIDPRRNIARSEAAAVLARYHGITAADIEAMRIAPVSVTVSAAGDCTLGKDKNAAYATSFPAMYANVGNPAYFFSNVYGVFSRDDLTIVNLEGTLTTQTARANKTFAFKGDPSYVKILTAGSVEAANLANNHSRDYGLQSYYDTIRYTEAAGIRTFGYDRRAVMEVNGVKVGLIGVYELPYGMSCGGEMVRQLNAVKRDGADIVIVSFHWGVERSNYPNMTQKRLAHMAVDNGADLVLGHHPHVLQGVEVYKGKNIVYSLANFCFGGNKNPADKDTMIFQQTFTLLDDELVRDNVSAIIPCRVSSVTTRNDYRPTILTGSEAERVLARIRAYSKGL